MEWSVVWQILQCSQFRCAWWPTPLLQSAQLITFTPTVCVCVCVLALRCVGCSMTITKAQRENEGERNDMKRESEDRGETGVHLLGVQFFSTPSLSFCPLFSSILLFSSLTHTHSHTHSLSHTRSLSH